MSFPILTELNTQGKKAIAYMKSKQYKVRALNIVYFEGLDADDMKTVNEDRLDFWNDVRAVIRDNGDVLMSCSATTEPGRYYRLNRMNPDGAAQLAFGQYLDAWMLGRLGNMAPRTYKMPLFNVAILQYIEMIMKMVLEQGIRFILAMTFISINTLLLTHLKLSADGELGVLLVNIPVLMQHL
jgi:hypothetical protein